MQKSTTDSSWTYNVILHEVTHAQRQVLQDVLPNTTFQDPVELISNANKPRKKQALINRWGKYIGLLADIPLSNELETRSVIEVLNFKVINYTNIDLIIGLFAMSKTGSLTLPNHIQDFIFTVDCSISINYTLYLNSETE